MATELVTFFSYKVLDKSRN